VCGTLGRIVIEAPFTPPPDGPACARLHTLDETRQLISPAANQYQLMGEAFAEAVFSGAEVPTPLEDAHANLKVIDAVFESGELGRWVSL